MSTTLLKKARNVPRPSRDAMLVRDPSVHQFWNDNEKTFEAAWSEWEQNGGHENITLDRSLYAPALRRAIEQAWKDPTQETSVRDLWTEVFPNVYKAQFFDPEKLSILRDYLDKVADAGIPLRPPYGISLNRGGAMLDPRSEGYLAAPTFQAFYQDLMDHYTRPVCVCFFRMSMDMTARHLGFQFNGRPAKIQSYSPIPTRRV